MEDNQLFVKSDDEAASDLTTLLIEIFNRNESLQKSPLYIVAESYGGKYAVTLGLSAFKAIESGKLKMKLGGTINQQSSPDERSIYKLVFFPFSFDLIKCELIKLKAIDFVPELSL